MFTVPRLERALATALAPLAAASQSAPSLCVALSGGLDSTVLCAALAQLAAGSRPLALRALHVDHALHADSARWAEASRSLAASLGLPLEVVRVDGAAAAGESPEAAARAARYAAFRTRLRNGEVLLTAHHADDQLETILLQWLRGGGLRSVGGMAPLAPFGAGAWLARPLLEFTRAEIEAWARDRLLDWIVDPSNDDRRFDRNYLRHEVLPVVRRRWPAAARTAGRVAEFAREAVALESELALGDLEQVRRGLALNVERLFDLPAARQRAVLRAWLGALGLPVPAAATLAALRRDMHAAAADRVPRTTWPGATVHRHRGWLHATRAEADEPQEGTWSTSASRTFHWTASGTLELVAAVGEGLSRERMPPEVVVRCREGGETFQPARSAHRRELRKILQEHDVLPWRRASLPLLQDATGCIVAVADLAVGEPYAARPGEPSWAVAWHGRGVVTGPDAFGFKWPPGTPIG